MYEYDVMTVWVDDVMSGWVARVGYSPYRPSPRTAEC